MLSRGKRAAENEDPDYEDSSTTSSEGSGEVNHSSWKYFPDEDYEDYEDFGSGYDQDEAPPRTTADEIIRYIF